MRIGTLRLVAVAAALLLAAVPVTVAAATSTAEPTLSFQSGAPTTILPTTGPTSLTASPTAAPSSPGATNSPTVVHPLCSSEGTSLIRVAKSATPLTPSSFWQVDISNGRAATKNCAPLWLGQRRSGRM